MISKSGDILSSTEEKLEEWKQYIQILFNDNKNVPSDIKIDFDITRDEVEYATKKSRKMANVQMMYTWN